MRHLLMLFLLVPAALAVPTKEALEAARSANLGWAAFCKMSLVDELQIIRGPIAASKEEVAELASIFGNEQNFRNDGTKKFCITYWDFKFLLHDEKNNRFVGIKLCTSCRDVGIQRDFYSAVQGGELLPEPMAKLEKLVNKWFPGWQAIAKNNRTEKLEAKRPQEP